MRKTLAVTLAGLVLIVLLAALVIAEVIQQPAWRAELDAYARHATTSRDEVITVTAVRRARHPHRFEQGHSHGTFGDDVYGARSLPFPPTRVWCVLVTRQRPGRGIVDQVLYVALHQDLHHAEWIVHQGETAPFGQRTLETLDELGCNLRLTPSR